MTGVGVAEATRAADAERDAGELGGVAEESQDSLGVVPAGSLGQHPRYHHEPLKVPDRSDE